MWESTIFFFRLIFWFLHFIHIYKLRHEHKLLNHIKPLLPIQLYRPCVYYLLLLLWRYHDEEHANLLNSMWLTAITFLCVGYGDIVPNTYCGRGITLTCGMVVSNSKNKKQKQTQRNQFGVVVATTIDASMKLDRVRIWRVCNDSVCSLRMDLSQCFRIDK